MKYNDLRGLLHYVPLFRGRTFVILIEGEIIGSENFSNVLMDLGVLHSLGLKLVLVFGARHQIVSLAKDRGIPLSSLDGIGATDDATLEVAMDAISRLNTHLLQQLTSVGLNAAVTNAVTAHPAGVINGEELRHTGSIDKVDEHLLAALVDKQTIPVLPPLGFEKSGRSLRLNSAALARQVAIEMKAEKLLFLVEHQFNNEAGRQIRQMTADEAMTHSKSIHDGAENSRAYQLRMAAEAVSGGVPRVHFVDGRLDEALLGELFSVEGTGTMIYEKPYQHVRPARKADIPHIASLVQPGIADQELVARSRTEVKEHLADYAVLEVDGNLVGVVYLHPYPKEKMAELGCLYIRKSHEGLGYGSRLVHYAENRAREFKVEHLFALSTQAYNYFESILGYSMADSSVLPEERRKKWEKSGRNSRILIKKLSTS